MLDVVREVAGRVSDLQRFEAIRARRHWLGYDLANGYGGICLLLGELDRLEPDAGWDERGHALLVEMQRDMQTRPVSSLSLWLGLAGVGLTVHSLSRGGTRYVKLAGQVDALLLQRLTPQLAEVELRLQIGAPLADYEVVQGLAGVGRYLLLHVGRAEMKEALERILTYLVQVAQPKHVGQVVVPGGYVAPELLRTDAERGEFPNGYWNLGQAHGMPGVLALLALALSAGVEVPGQRAAVERVGDWLVEWKLEDEAGPFWNRLLTWEEWQSGQASKGRHREAWCYGSPGVARTLWIAGRAAGRKDWQEVALAAYQATFARPEELWDLTQPNLCHGWSGLMHMTHLMWQDSGADDLALQRDQLLERLRQAFDPQSPFGYGRDPGLLNGAAGVALALLGQLEAGSSSWDSAFLIK